MKPTTIFLVSDDLYEFVKTSTEATDGMIILILKIIIIIFASGLLYSHSIILVIFPNFFIRYNYNGKFVEKFYQETFKEHTVSSSFCNFEYDL